MQPFTKLTGIAAPLPMVNVDTDKIIPAHHLKTIKRTGLGVHLFETLRYHDDGSERPDFVLNRRALPQGRDPDRRREFRLRQLARACALGAARLRHPLRDRAQLRRHLLQQLLQERRPADRTRAGADRAPAARGGRGQEPDLHVDLEQQHDPAADRQRAVRLRGRSVPQALPAERPRRRRPDHAEGPAHRPLREPAARRPALAASRARRDGGDPRTRRACSARSCCCRATASARR